MSEESKLRLADEAKGRLAGEEPEAACALRLCLECELGRERLCEAALNLPRLALYVREHGEIGSARDCPFRAEARQRKENPPPSTRTKVKGEFIMNEEKRNWNGELNEAELANVSGGQVEDTGLPLAAREICSACEFQDRGCEKKLNRDIMNAGRVICLSPFDCPYYDHGNT